MRERIGFYNGCSCKIIMNFNYDIKFTARTKQMHEALETWVAMGLNSDVSDALFEGETRAESSKIVSGYGLKLF